jgi:spore coat polysaccharide biosynthesis protein SpsF
MDSSRLPGKLLMTVNNIPLIQYVVERSKKVERFTDLVLATTDRSVDDSLAAYAQSQDVSVYRGMVHDVAGRIIDCAREYQADYLIRLNADSPFVDPELIMEGISVCESDRPEFVTNIIGRTFPYGISVEIIQTKAFERAYAEMKREDEFEHVTRYLYQHLDQFRTHSMKSRAPDLRRARLVVDTIEDLDVFARMVNRLNQNALTIGYVEAAKMYYSVV